MAAAVLGGGLVRGFAGFGSAMVIVPLVSIIASPVQAVMTVAVCELPALAILLPMVRRNADWRRILPLLLAAVPAIPLGVALLLAVDPVLMSRIIGGIVLLFVVLLGTGWRAKRRPGLPMTLAAGVTAGTLSGSTGIGGPPVVIYFLSGQDDARTSRANIIGYFIGSDMVALATLLLAGAVDSGQVAEALVVSPGYVLGVWLGGRLFGLASEVTFRRVALGLLICVAVLALAH